MQNHIHLKVKASMTMVYDIAAAGHHKAAAKIDKYTTSFGNQSFY